MTVNALQMNLSALQRQDRAITAITETSPQVTLYSFDGSLKQWSRTEIEGSLFICSRSGDPKCCLIILNKKDPRNHKETISRGLEVQVQDKFLLYKSSNGAVYGLWFYDEKECTRVAASLQKIIKGLDHKSKAKRMSSVPVENVSPNLQRSNSKPVPQRNGQACILTMLSQAQQRYDEDRKRQHSPTQSSPQESTTTIYSGANSNQGAPVIQISNGHSKTIKILQKPKTSPESEKSDSVVPSVAVPSAESSFTPFSPLSNRICPVQQPVEMKSENTTAPSPMASEDTSNSALDSPFSPIKASESPSPPMSDLTFASNLLTPELLTMSLAEQDDNMLNFHTPQSNDALLSPEALLGSHSSGSTTSLPSVGLVPTVLSSAVSVPDMMLPEASGVISPTVGSGKASTSPINESNMLTRDQLRAAMVSLIQTDDDFVTKLHEAYMKQCVCSSE